MYAYKGKGIMAYCEVSEGKLTEISTEVLGCGRRLAYDLGEQVSAVILGRGISDSAKEAISLGADKVYVVDDPLLEHYQTDIYLSAMEKLATQLKPQIILMGQTTIGRDLAPSLAFRLETAATLDCVDLAIDNDSKRLLQTKPVYGGNALAIFTTDRNPQIATVRKKAMKSLEPDATKSGEIIKTDMDLNPQVIRAKVLEKMPEQAEGIRLEAAKVVVGGGRGIGSAEGFDKLNELAVMFNGVVGASRAACDNGWFPTTKQIGLTGKVIIPDIYFAIGISGAIQHMAGCYGAENIIAINKDDGANIFREAHYGVVGDWKLVLSGFMNKLKELGVGKE